MGYPSYLEPTPYCESGSEEILQLAERITKDAKNDEEKVHKIFLWVRDNIRWKPVKIVGAKKLLKREPKVGLCTDKTNLFVALCRSVGIKSRYIVMDANLKTVNKELPPQGKHIAAEVNVGGKWILADPGFGKNTSKLLEVSEFGKPAWTEAKNMKRQEGLSRPFILIVNFYMKHSPFGKNIRKVVAKAETN
jgi:transglutaminase-like putative cysteine protease